MSNKDTIIEALTMELRLEREGNLALAKRNCDNCESLRLAGLDRIKELEDKLLEREWVGLTDDEIYDYADKFLYQHGSNYGIRSFGKAIEAKLKEKNG